MNIFVIGTGRCGTTTFTKACKHIKNYTASHESNTHGLMGNNFKYKDNHIEVDPRLSHFLPLLKEKYNNALFVHLQREREECIESLSKRSSLLKYGDFHLGGPSRNNHLYKLAEIYYDNTNKLIKNELNGVNSIHIWLDDLENQWDNFCNSINANCDLISCKKELKIKYNKGT